MSSASPFKGNVTAQDAQASRALMQWIQQIMDQPLGQMVVTATGVCPGIKKHGTILWKDTQINKTYIVHYDGTKKYFWLSDGTDLY